jgi:uncharacterized membrane protein
MRAMVVDPNRSSAAGAWAGYSPAWTTWNHVRTFTSFAGAATFVLALRVG